MKNFLVKNFKHKHSFEEIIYYKKNYFDHQYFLTVYKVQYCNCGKRKDKIIFDKVYTNAYIREEAIRKFISAGAIPEEEFAIKYR